MQEFTVTECTLHGERVTDVSTPDGFSSARAYVEAAWECRILREAEDMGHSHHSDDHAYEGTDCWKCCNLMVIDPQGWFDH